MRFGCLWSGLVFVASAAVSPGASAMINVGGGIWCAYETWDGQSLTYHRCIVEGVGFFDPLPPHWMPDPPDGPPSGPPGPPAGGGDAMPDPPDIDCLLDFMASANLAPVGPVNVSHLWAFTKIGDVSGPQLEYSTQSSVAPDGYRQYYGDTAKTPPHTITLYAGRFSPRDASANPVQYIDPAVGNAVTHLDYGSFSAVEWTIVALGHELAHRTGQAGGGPPGSYPENLATGWGMYALWAYRELQMPCGE